MVRSRERPRDAIQLVNELASEAIKRKSLKIDEAIFQKVMPSFSRSITDQYGEENRQEFPEAIMFVRSLAEAQADQGRFIFSAEAILDHFKRMLGRSGVTFNGVRLPNSDQTAFEVWRFLYASGVINARTSDESQPKGYSHLPSADDPFLVDRANWNRVQKYLWEVAPVYRDYLVDLANSQKGFSGLATKKKIKSRRR